MYILLIVAVDAKLVVVYMHREMISVASQLASA